MRNPFMQTQPAPWLRLLANWGLSLSGAACLLPAEEEGRCPLRPLLAVVQRPAKAAPAGRHGRR